MLTDIECPHPLFSKSLDPPLLRVNFLIIILLSIVVILLLFLYYLNNDLDASSVKDNYRAGLQIKAESIPTDSKSINLFLQTERRIKGIYMKQVVQTLSHITRNKKMVRSTLLPLSHEKRTNVPNSLKRGKSNIIFSGLLTLRTTGN